MVQFGRCDRTKGQVPITCLAYIHYWHFTTRFINGGERCFDFSGGIIEEARIFGVDEAVVDHLRLLFALFILAWILTSLRALSVELSATTLAPGGRGGPYKPHAELLGPAALRHMLCHVSHLRRCCAQRKKKDVIDSRKAGLMENSINNLEGRFYFQFSQSFIKNLFLF